MSVVQSHNYSKKRIFRKARRYILHYILLAAFCLAIAFIMCYTVFFKLDKIKISGCTVYSETQIVDEIGAQKGESLFKVNISNAQKKLLGTLPYIRSVKITRQLPTTLKVEIEEEDVLGAVYTDSGFALISTTGKVLETGVLALKEGVPQIVGITGQTYSTGSYVKESSNLNAELIPQIKALQTVQAELEKNGFQNITYYDVTDMLNLKVMIEDRLLFKLGTETNMDYKVSFIKEVLDGKERGDEDFENVPEEGTLDFSNPPALHAMSIDIDKVKNEDAYRDFGVEMPAVTDNVVGGEESEPMQPLTPSTQETAEDGQVEGDAQQQPMSGQQQGETVQEEENPAQPTITQAQTQTDVPSAAPQVNEVNGVVQNTGGGQPSGGGIGGTDSQTSSGAVQQQSQQQTPNQSGQHNVQPSTQSGDLQTNQDSDRAGSQNGSQSDSQNGQAQNQSGGNVFNAPSRAPIVN